jgi:hypothetical protein
MKNFIFLIILFSVITACDKGNNNPPPPDPTCENGFEWTGDTCECPSNKFMFGPIICDSLRKNELYAFCEDCPCQDSLFINFEKFDTTTGIAKVGLRTSNPEPVGVLYQFNKYIRTDFNFKTDIQGDSIWSHYTGYMPSPCFIDGLNTTRSFYGRMIGKDLFRAKIYYMKAGDFTVNVDSCTVIFHK